MRAPGRYRCTVPPAAGPFGPWLRASTRQRVDVERDRPGANRHRGDVRTNDRRDMEKLGDGPAQGRVTDPRRGGRTSGMRQRRIPGPLATPTFVRGLKRHRAKVGAPRSTRIGSTRCPALGSRGPPVSSHVKRSRATRRRSRRGRPVRKSVVDLYGRWSADGRPIAADVKYVATERLQDGTEAAWRLPLDRVEDHQRAMLRRCHRTAASRSSSWSTPPARLHRAVARRRGGHRQRRRLAQAGRDHAVPLRPPRTVPDAHPRDTGMTTRDECPTLRPATAPPAATTPATRPRRALDVADDGPTRSTRSPPSWACPPSASGRSRPARCDGCASFTVTAPRWTCSPSLPDDMVYRGWSPWRSRRGPPRIVFRNLAFTFACAVRCDSSNRRDCMAPLAQSPDQFLGSYRGRSTLERSGRAPPPYSSPPVDVAGQASVEVWGRPGTPTCTRRPSSRSSRSFLEAVRSVSSLRKKGHPEARYRGVRSATETSRTPTRGRAFGTGTCCRTGKPGRWR